jgi:hypothetical protein
MNVIREIDAGISEEDFDSDMRSESCTWKFGVRPKELKTDDLMFFAYHRRVRSVGRVARVADSAASDGTYAVDTVDHMYFTCDLEWEDRSTELECTPVTALDKELGGEYAALKIRLERVVEDYNEYFPDEPTVFLPPL